MLYSSSSVWALLILCTSVWALRILYASFVYAEPKPVGVRSADSCVTMIHARFTHALLMRYSRFPHALLREENRQRREYDQRVSMLTYTDFTHALLTLYSEKKIANDASMNKEYLPVEGLDRFLKV